MTLSVAALVSLLVPACLIGQQRTPPDTSLAAGAKLRVTVRDEGRTTGRLRFVREQNLGLAVGRDSVLREIPLSSVELLEVATGTRSQAGKGALIGGGLGLVQGLICFAEADEEGYVGEGFVGIGQETCFLGSVAMGAGIGALIGVLDRTDTWRRVPTEGLSVALRRLPGGAVGLGIAVSH